MNHIREYNQKIQSGEIIAGKRIKAIYSRLVDDLDNPKHPYVFDEAKATRPIEFIERFIRTSKGPTGGRPLRLMLWQKAALEAIFGFVHEETGLRKYREVMLWVSRKNGKSVLASAIALYLLIADGEPGAQIITAATKIQQARIIFDESLNMVKQSPDLSLVLTKRKNDLYFPARMGTMFPVGRNYDTLDGLNGSGVFIDELHATTREQYEVLKQSQSARSQPLMVLTTTSGTRREGIFDDMLAYARGIVDGEKHDETFLPLLYELDSRAEWTQPQMWVKANPSLSVTKSVEDLITKCERAKQSPRDLIGVLCKDFNLVESSSSAFLSYGDIENPEQFDMEQFRGSACVMGFDLSATTDLTVATVMMLGDDKRIYVKQMAFLPENRLEARAHEDHIPYPAWRDEGLLRVCPGAIIDYHMITEWFNEMVQTYDLMVVSVGYDAWSATYLRKELEEQGYPLRPVRQGERTLSDPLKRIGEEFRSKNIVHNNNPITVWCWSNLNVQESRNGGLLPVKMQSIRRIDAAMSMLDAYIVFIEHYEEIEMYNNRR